MEGEAGVKPRSPKGRAVARGLDARIHFQHPFIPAGDTPPKSHQPIKIPLTVITVSTANAIAKPLLMNRIFPDRLKPFPPRSANPLGVFQNAGRK